MPDEPLQSTPMTPGEFAAGGPSGDPGPIATPSPSAPSPPATPGAPATGHPSPSTSEPSSFRDIVSGLGYQWGSDVQDDYSALHHLVQQASLAQRLSQEQRQQDVFAQLGRQLAPRANDLQQFFQGQEREKTAPRSYEPPEFDPKWESLVERDQVTGLYVSKRGVPEEFAAKANAYAEWTANFLRNPMKVLQPAFEDQRNQALEQARQEFRAMLAQEQTRREVDQIVQQNARWYYATDAAGNFIPDPVNGGYQASQTGRLYLQALQSLQSAGVANPAHRDRFARMMIADKIAAATQQPSPATPGASAAVRQEHALAGNRAGNRNALQSLSPLERGQTPGATEPEQHPVSLAQRMLAQLEAEGVRTADYFAEGV